MFDGRLSTISEDPRPHMGVPGQVPAVGRMSHEAKKFADEIKSKSAKELRELKARQEAVFRNKKLLASLPDKGEKVKMKIQEIDVSQHDKMP